MDYSLCKGHVMRHGQDQQQSSRHQQFPGSIKGTKTRKRMDPGRIGRSRRSPFHVYLPGRAGLEIPLTAHHRPINRCLWYYTVGTSKENGKIVLVVL